MVDLRANRGEMKVETIPSGRAKFEEGGDASLRIIVPPKRHVLIVPFVCAWIVGWFFAAPSAIEQLPTANDPAAQVFVMFWIIGWTLAGAFVMFSVLWMLLGLEVLELRWDVLVHSREICGVGVRRVYDLAHIRNLRLGPMNPDPFRYAKRANAARAAAAWGLSGGPIVFDYGAKTARCGAGLDEEAEARQIIERMIQRDARLGANGAAWPRETRNRVLGIDRTSRTGR